MATRKPTFRTGTPAIQPARALDLRTLQQAIDNIRERFLNAEAQVSFLQSVADASVATSDLTTMKAQLAALSQSLNVLIAQVNATTESDTVSLLLMLEGKMRAIASAATRDLEPPNSANAVLMQRMFNPR